MRVGALWGLLLVAVATMPASAGITSYTCAADGDGAVTLDEGRTTWTDLGDANYELEVFETLHWGPGHLKGTFEAPSDPTVSILKEVVNATSYDWNGYSISVFMDNPFTLVSAAGPLGWAVNPGPVLSGGFADADGRSWAYKADIAFTSNGNDILVGGSGDFFVKFTFDGTVEYELEQMYVPEPASLGLLALSGLALVRRRR